jgi:hypothetical protein
VPLEESPSTLLDRLHTAECSAAAVLSDVELNLGDEWPTTATRTIEGELTLTQRKPGVTATVEEVLGNVIFKATRADGGSGPVLAVSDDQPSASAAITVYAARCDAHALIEYKRTFILQARVRVGDDEPVLVDVKAEGPAHSAMETVLAACIV